MAPRHGTMGLSRLEARHIDSVYIEYASEIARFYGAAGLLREATWAYIGS
jgi:hypothetical protein